LLLHKKNFIEHFNYRHDVLSSPVRDILKILIFYAHFSTNLSTTDVAFDGEALSIFDEVAPFTVAVDEEAERTGGCCLAEVFGVEAAPKV
jgi:hypothetical protein